MDIIDQANDVMDRAAKEIERLRVALSLEQRRHAKARAANAELLAVCNILLSGNFDGACKAARRAIAKAKETT